MAIRYIPIITELDKKLPYYVLDVGCHWQQEHIVRPNGYRYQWIQCIKGEGELITAGQTFRIKEGTAMFLIPGVPHEYYAISSTWIVDWIAFDGSQVEQFFKHTVGVATSGVFYLSRPDIFTNRIRNILEIGQSDSTYKYVKCSGVLYSLLMDIMQYASVNPNNSSIDQHLKLGPLYDYIEKNISHPMTLEVLSNVIGVTPQHLCTLFKKTAHIRIFQYINSIRIKKSKEALIYNPQLPIKAIAHMVGFDDVNYFCSVFKKIESISPGQFRKMHLS